MIIKDGHLLDWKIEINFEVLRLISTLKKVFKLKLPLIK